MTSKNKFVDQSEYFDKEVKYFSNLQERNDSHQELIIKFFLQKLREESKGNKILEIGGGTGMYTIPMLKEGHKVTAVDLSKGSLDACVEFARKADVLESLTVINSPMELLDIKNKFNAVVGRHILHHLEDLPETAKKAFSLLDAEGVSIFIEPNPLCPFWYLYITLDRTRKWEIEKNIPKCTPFRLRKIFRDAEFSKVTTQYYGFMPSGLVRKFPVLGKLNTLFSNIPFIKNLMALQIIIAKK